MASTGAKKAAMLLRTLDPSTAAELLQSAEPEMLTEIAVEVAFLEQSGNAGISAEPMKEFSGLLQGQRTASHGGAFAKQMLQIVLGDEGSQEVLTQVDQRMKKLDPFREIRSADPVAIAAALAGESAQAASVVLSELPSARSAKLLGLLDEATRSHAVGCMAGAQEISLAARQRIAGVVLNRMQEEAKKNAAVPDAAKGSDQSRKRYRKVAVLLRGLEVELRNQMIESLVKEDGEAAKGVQELMVIWDDINIVAERSLQDALMSVDTRQLALALVDADRRIVERINNNMSERAQGMLEEEASLLSNPKESEIEPARDQILKVLREMNKRGELEFEESGSK